MYELLPAYTYGVYAPTMTRGWQRVHVIVSPVHVLLVAAQYRVVGAPNVPLLHVYVTLLSVLLIVEYSAS
ncbi:MAG: hypothetical protein EOO65_02820 [Methanosarcinales archaeon]|nr:MAG: hypothetical protein EOO65_02820 [Methanosarcinales archaeon]